MKRIIAIFLAVAAFTAVSTGCGNNNNNSKNETSASTSVTQDNTKDNSDVNSSEDAGRVRDNDGIIGNEDYENNDNGIIDDAGDFVEDGIEGVATVASEVVSDVMH